MKIVVAGAGSIGCSLAARLRLGGEDPVLVCRSREQAEEINKKGLRITGEGGTHTVSIKACCSTDEIDKADVIIITTKAYDLEKVRESMKSCLLDDGIFIALQNGIGKADERTVSSVVTWGATLKSPSHVDLTADGELFIGWEDKKADERIFLAADVLSRGFKTHPVDNILEMKYSKLIINCCMTSIGALCGLDLGPTLKICRARKIFIKIVEEAMAVAEAAGIKVPDFNDSLDYYGFNESCALKKHIVIRIVGARFKRLTSSSLQSLRKGKPTEVDYLNGYIADRARELQIPSPVNSRIVKMVHEIEEGKRKIEMSNLYQVDFR